MPITLLDREAPCTGGLHRPLASARHARWIDQHLMLKMPHAALEQQRTVTGSEEPHLYVAYWETLPRKGYSGLV